jgi:hypothetical protein
MKSVAEISRGIRHRNTAISLKGRPRAIIVKLGKHEKGAGHRWRPTTGTAMIIVGVLIGACSSGTTLVTVACPQLAARFSQLTAFEL